MSDQNPAPEPPQAPRESVGSAPPGAETIGSAPEPAQPTPTKKSPLPRILLTVAIAVVVLAGGAFWLLRGSASSPEVGSCFDESVFTQQSTTARTVDCADASAKYRVVGIVDDKTSDQLDPDQNCAEWNTAVAAIWLGARGGSGKVYCVEEVTPS